MSLRVILHQFYEKIKFFSDHNHIKEYSTETQTCNITEIPSTAQYAIQGNKRIIVDNKEVVRLFTKLTRARKDQRVRWATWNQEDDQPNGYIIDAQKNSHFKELLLTCHLVKDAKPTGKTYLISHDFQGKLDYVSLVLSNQGEPGTTALSFSMLDCNELYPNPQKPKIELEAKSIVKEILDKLESHRTLLSSATPGYGMFR